jgi:hypothetical protein
MAPTLFRVGIQCSQGPCAAHRTMPGRDPGPSAARCAPGAAATGCQGRSEVAGAHPFCGTCPAHGFSLFPAAFISKARRARENRNSGQLFFWPTGSRSGLRSRSLPCQQAGGAPIPRLISYLQSQAQALLQVRHRRHANLVVPRASACEPARTALMLRAATQNGENGALPHPAQHAPAWSAGGRIWQ